MTSPNSSCLPGLNEASKMAGLARLFKARGGMLRSDEESILEPRGT